jgi:hypothetical protein
VAFDMVGAIGLQARADSLGPSVFGCGFDFGLRPADRLGTDAEVHIFGETGDGTEDFGERSAALEDGLAAEFRRRENQAEQPNHPEILFGDDRRHTRAQLVFPKQGSAVFGG